MRLIVPEQHVSGYKKKVDSTYRPGYGTVLFFESHKILEEWAQKMPNYSKVSPGSTLPRPSSLTRLAILYLV
jgi:predicted oxidoreductase (fatty acid repression mutant protein)